MDTFFNMHYIADTVQMVPIYEICIWKIIKHHLENLLHLADQITDKTKVLHEAPSKPKEERGVTKNEG